MNLHIILTSQFVFWVICALGTTAIGITLYLIQQRIKLRRRITPRERYEDQIEDLIEETIGALKKLRRAAKASKRLNRILSLIEIVGGGYFAIASGIGAAIGAQTPTRAQLELNLVVGFAIVVASGIQNRFHPYANGVELDHRAWALEVAKRKAESELNIFLRSSSPNHQFPLIEDDLNKAMAEAMRPFSSGAPAGSSPTPSPSVSSGPVAGSGPAPTPSVPSGAPVGAG